MRDQLQKGLDFDGTPIWTINVKRRSHSEVFHEHFLSNKHKDLMNDIEIVFIDKTDPLYSTKNKEV